MREAFVGIDFATQSARAILIDSQGKVLARTSRDLAPVIRGAGGRLTQDPLSWLVAIDQLLGRIRDHALELQHVIQGLCISATSGSFVLTDYAGAPVAPAAMYNDGRGASPLARAVKIIEEVGQGNYLFAHTPEYVIAHLLGLPLADISTDWSHAMKTGVDLHSGKWRDDACALADSQSIQLPAIVAPGTLMGRTRQGDIPIYSGMTDGCTAQISVGGASLGSAVTSLGTTLVLKVVAEREITGPGFYSHLLPSKRWLGGAASNLGGISYSKFHDEIEIWNEKADKHGPASCVMYPLVGTGDRFPVVNKALTSLSTSLPTDETDEYRAILEGVAFAERLAYETLASAGAPIHGNVYSVGGGSRSKIWSMIRATVMNRPICIVKDSGSDLGAALIAAASHHGGDLAHGLDQFNSSTNEMVLPNEIQSEIYENKYQEFLLLIEPFQSSEIR